MGESSHYVLVSQRYPPEKGGNASRIRDTAVNLVADDRSVTVLAPPPCYPPGNFDRTWRRSTTERVDGVRVRRLWAWQPQAENPGLPQRLAYYLTFALHALLWLVFNRRSYDAVLTSTPPIATGLPGLVAGALGAPWIVDVRDLWIDNAVSLGYVDGDSLLVGASRRFQQLVLHAADRVTVTTEGLGDAIVDTYGAALRNRIRVVPNGVDTDRFSPRGRPAQGGDTDEQVVVYTGNLGSAQPLEACIRAMAALPRDDVVLRFVGDGDDATRLAALADRLDLDDCVEFAGLVDRDEVTAHISDAAVGLAPIRDTDELAYAMPTKTYEYLACAVPVLVTGRGEIRRFVDSSGGGVHAESSPEAIADGLETLLDDAEKRARMGRDGREHVVEQFDRDRIADRLAAEFETLVDEQQASESSAAPVSIE